jgi:hypothetical protein
VAISSPLEIAIEREYQRLWAIIPTERRPKLQAAARVLAKDVDAQRTAGKALATSDAMHMARSACKRVGVDLSGMSADDVMKLVLFLVSRDARDEIKATLEEMNATKKRRAALHEAADAARDAQASLKLQRAKERHAKTVASLAPLVPVGDAGVPDAAK